MLKRRSDAIYLTEMDAFIARRINLNLCMQAKLLPANLLTRRAAILMRSYISGLMENWLFAPQSFDLKEEARSYVAILLEMLQLCPTLRSDAPSLTA